MRINRDSTTAWNNWDPETVRNTEGGVHHGASAVQNLRAIGEDGVHAVLPDRAIDGAIWLGKLNPVLGAVGFVLGLLFDALELIVFPLMFLKNLIDMGAHGTKAAVNAVKKEEDGAVARETIRPLDLRGDTSFQRQWRGLTQR